MKPGEWTTKITQEAQMQIVIMSGILGLTAGHVDLVLKLGLNLLACGPCVLNS